VTEAEAAERRRRQRRSAEAPDEFYALAYAALAAAGAAAVDPDIKRSEVRAAYDTATALAYGANATMAWQREETRSEEHRVQADLLRDIFGNPFRAVLVAPAWLSWNGETVLRLAESIYQERAFERLPILADALEDAGCTDSAILEHCRGPEPHVRGCWAIDLLLGKR
jgi:hypothetical protein